MGPGFGSKSGAPSRLLCHGDLDARVVSERNTDPAVSICCEFVVNWRPARLGGWTRTAHQKEEAVPVLEPAHGAQRHAGRGQIGRLSSL